MAKTDTHEIMLGRYHAREVTLAQLQRRRLEAAENLKAANKAMKKLKAEAPAEGTEIERRRWLEKIGEQELEVDKLTAEKAAAEQALNAHIGNKALPLFGSDPERVAKDCISGGMVLLFEQGYSPAAVEEVAEVELMIAASRFDGDKTADENRTAGDQATLFPAAPAKPEDERLAKLRAKAQKAAERAARAEARLTAAEKGEPVPSFGGGKKGDLPAVHDLNRLARHARCMHRAAEWTWDGPDHAGKAEAVSYLKAARDAAIAEWTAGVEKRRAAGAGDAKALHAMRRRCERAGIDYKAMKL